VVVHVPQLETVSAALVGSRLTIFAKKCMAQEAA
jgi:hypothetical protein